MNKDYFIINASDRLDAATLRMLRTFLRQYLRLHKKASLDEIRTEFLNHLKFVYKFYMYEVFHDPEHFKFVKRVENIEEGPDSFTPLFTLHDDMYSTMIKHNKTLKTEAHGVNRAGTVKRCEAPEPHKLEPTSWATRTSPRRKPWGRHHNIK